MIIINSKSFKINCSKAMLIIYIFSLSPTFAMDNTEDSLDTQNIIESPVLSNNTLDATEELNGDNNLLEEQFEQLESIEELSEDNTKLVDDKSEEIGSSIINTDIAIEMVEDENTNNYISVDDSISYDTTLSKILFEKNTTYLTSEFHPQTKEYKAIVTGNLTTIDFQPSAGKSIYVNSKTSKMNVYLNDNLLFSDVSCLGEGMYRYSLQLEQVSSNKLRLEVISEGGSVDNYFIEFIRLGDSDASLSRISFTGSYQGNVVLNKEYNSSEQNYIACSKYTTNVGFSSHAFQTVSVKDPFATMDIYYNGELVQDNVRTSKDATYILIPNFNNRFDFVVTSNDGTCITYTVLIERYGSNDTSLKYLGFYGVYNEKGAVLDTSLSVDKFNYELLLKNGQTQVGFLGYAQQYVAVNDSYATMNVYLNDKIIFENIKRTPDSFFDLEPNIQNELKFEVFSESNEVGYYFVTIQRQGDDDTLIKSLKINNELLESKNDKYYIELKKWNDIKINTLVLNDVWANYKIILNGKKEIGVNEKFDLEIGENNLDIEVTSNNGTKKTYPVVFKRTDNIAPTVNSSVNINDWTNNDVLISIDASDDSGIRYIELPTGEKVYSNAVEFYANKNGTYKFKVYDNFLNETIKTVNVNNIDKEAPKLELKASTTELTNSTVDISINASDNIAVKYIEAPDGTFITDSNSTYTVKEDGTYTFKVVDHVGNEAVKSITLNNIDSVSPVLATELSTDDWSNEDLTLSVLAISEKGIKYIELPDGSKVENTVAEYDIKENGVYMITAESLGGNVTTEKVVVDNIDTEQPTLTLNPSTKDWTNKNVEISINAKDNVGIDYIILPDGKIVYDSKYIYSIGYNGTYEFTVVDLAGNSYTQEIKIKNIDKQAPVIEDKDGLIDISKHTIKLNISQIKTFSGIKKIILPNGKEILNSENTTIKFNVSENGIYRFTIVSNAGCETNIDVPISLFKDEYINNDIGGSSYSNSIVDDVKNGIEDYDVGSDNSINENTIDDISMSGDDVGGGNSNNIDNINNSDNNNAVGGYSSEKLIINDSKNSIEIYSITNLFALLFSSSVALGFILINKKQGK